MKDLKFALKLVYLLTLAASIGVWSVMTVVIIMFAIFAPSYNENLLMCCIATLPLLIFAYHALYCMYNNIKIHIL